MAVIGSMAAILMHERKRMREIESESVEIHRIRQSINMVHLYITGLSLSGESVIGWKEADYLRYHAQRLQTDSLLLKVVQLMWKSTTMTTITTMFTICSRLYTLTPTGKQDLYMQKSLVSAQENMSW